MTYPAEISLSISLNNETEKLIETINSILTESVSAASDGTVYINCRDDSVEGILSKFAEAGIAACGEVSYPTGEAIRQAFEIRPDAQGVYSASIYSAVEIAQSQIWDEVLVMINEGSTIDQLHEYAFKQRISANFDQLY